MERASRPSAGASSSKQQTGWVESGSAFLRMPAIPALGVDSGVTGFTEGNEVVACVCAALRERYLVMHRFGGGQPAIPLAQFTQRMLLDVPVADALPGAAIPAAYSRVTVVLLVAFGFRLACSSQNLPSVSLGQPGYEQGRLGFVGTVPPPFRA